MGKQVFTLEKHGSIMYRTTDFLIAKHSEHLGVGVFCSVPTKFDIECMKCRGLSRQQAAEEAMGQAGVFNIAFFGHKGRPEHRSRVRRIWTKISLVYDEPRTENNDETLKP